MGGREGCAGGTFNCFGKVTPALLVYALRNSTDLVDSGSNKSGVAVLNSSSMMWGVVTGPFSGTTALWFNATDKGYASLPVGLDLRAVQGSTGITLTAWFRMDRDTGMFGRLFDFNNGDETGGLSSFWKIGRTGMENRLRCGISVAGLPFVYCDMNVYAVDAKWHHIAWSIDVSGYWNVYVDFSLVTVCSLKSNVPVIPIGSRKYWLGRSMYASNGWASMALYDLRLYAGALSLAQVVYEYDASSRSGMSLEIAYDPYGIAEGVGSTWTCATLNSSVFKDANLSLVYVAGGSRVSSFNLL
jgi:hypothetical protein